MICAKLQEIRQQIAEAAERSGRNPDDVRLLAVSKRQGLGKIREAFQCGQLLFGENYLQEARDKIARLDPAISWHFIGHLQSNKAKTAVELFQMVETVDRLKIAQALDNHAAALGRCLDILVQVNIGREKQKSGVEPQHAGQLIQEVGKLTHLRVRGLMAMPPYAASPEESRPYFKALKNLAGQFTAAGLFSQDSPVELSMGMSGDFIVAVEEGATLVRVGTALFGERAG
ncbi:MAG: YggS family pyridoxal phosphate-dependent enzyme [Proteobacteria bacterium]|nr:YggS family pyridoxal phosphate-dependent enzyme [Pseudomonadota bacterium]